ncbi:MAG: tetratricopeptide repeat protein [Bacteroidales bacterium]|nr:tetratricopeptide repeat protein [Bacteroidales bacterium]
MSSIIEGFNYDIFISYRQKDNKYDGWVTKFVDNLTRELEATFKEEISVYFDINPHDGLLETHDVDASLKEKLKCLVFIPIISRTYCDPKSFAWEHEFKAFVEMASQDQFGLKVKLPNGNVANRVLPVRIHDLDSTDIKLCESLLGGVLRGIGFIYKEPGVNKPLTYEDDEKKNINGTKYRIQINKVANAIKEIISGLQTALQVSEEKVSDEQQTVKAIQAKKKRWIYSMSSSVVIIMVVIALFVFSSGSTLPFSKRDWIVITDFENLTQDPVFDKSLYTAFSLSLSQSRYINIYSRSRMVESLALMEIKNQEFVDEKTGREMALREGFNICISPSISEVSNRYVITAKILETKTGNLLRSEILYAETPDEILTALDQLSKKIRRHLGESRFEIAGQNRKLVEVTTSSLEALKQYTTGCEHHIRQDFTGAKEYYEIALGIDSGFTAAQASLGSLLIESFNNPVEGCKLLNQAVKSVDKLTNRERLVILSIHALNAENDLPKSIKFTKKLIELYPDDPIYHNNMGVNYQKSNQFKEAVEEYKIAVRIDPRMALTYVTILYNYFANLRRIDSALVWAHKLISDHPQNAWGYFYLGVAYTCLDSIAKAGAEFERAWEINTYFHMNSYNLVHTYRIQKRYTEAIRILEKIKELDQSEITRVYYHLGINYQSMGNQKEALNYYSRLKKIYTEVWIKRWPDNAEIYNLLALVSARLDEMDYSNQMLQKAIEIDSSLNNRFAEILCLQGKIPEALNYLEQALDNGYSDLCWLKLSPDLQVLQYDIRFRELLEKYFKISTYKQEILRKWLNEV